jgi:hypothetical protein
VLHVGVGLLVLLGALAGAVPARRADGVASAPLLDLYRFPATATEVAGLRAAGIDVVALRPGGVAEAVLSDGDLARVRSAGLRPERWRDPGGRTVVDVAQSQAAGGHLVWRSWDEPGGLRDELTGLARSYPDLVSTQVIGRSVQGRDILAVRVTGGGGQVADGSRPAVLYLSLQHSREWISGEITRRLLRSVVTTYGVDPQTTRLLDTTELWFVVVANPDGYELTFQPGQRLWRKNLADNDGDRRLTEADGVDLNRNFPDHWGYSPAGSSTIPADQIFRGAAPASEPETRAIVDLARRVPFRFVLNYHSFGQLILYPFGWQEQTPTADQPIYTALAGTTLTPAVPGYRPKLSTDLYPTNGETASWFSTETGSLAFSVELGEGAPGMGFLFPDNEALVEQEFQLNRPFALDLARSAADPAHPVSHRGATAAPFVTDPFGVSYGDPQPVQVTAARHLGAVTLHWQMAGGPVQSAPTVEWDGGLRYGATGDRYYRRVRGDVTGVEPGQTARVWFSANGQRSDEFTYQRADVTGSEVLVVAGADHSRSGVTAGGRLAPFLDALEANGTPADVYDVDAQGGTAPHPLGVLGHYRAVIWSAGEPPGEGTGSAPTTVSRLANTEMLALRDYLNEGGRLLYTGRRAGASYAERHLYNPGGDSPCPEPRKVPGLDAKGTVERHSPCVPLSDEFFTSWLGAYEQVAGGGAAPDGSLSPAGGTAAPFAGLEWSFTRGASGRSAVAYLPMAETYGATYPHLGGRTAARYRHGPPPKMSSRNLPPPAAVVTTPNSILFGFAFEDVDPAARPEMLGRALRYLLPAPEVGRSAAVTHAGVLHAEHVGFLVVGLEAGVEDLADEERVAAAVDRVRDPAVDVGHGLVQDRRPRRPVVEGEPVEGPGLEVDLHGLHELPHDGPVLPVEDEQREHPAIADQLVGVGVLLHADPHQLGVEADLGRPVERHQVALVPVSRPDHIQPVRHLPEHAPAELVVLLLVLVRLDASGEGADGGSGLGRHASDPTWGASRACDGGAAPDFCRHLTRIVRVE